MFFFFALLIYSLRDTSAIEGLDDSESLALRNNQGNFEAAFAKHDLSECADAGGYKGCAQPTPEVQTIDRRYVNIPTNQLHSSNDYNLLSICPQTYQANMEVLAGKRSIGQYSGYTPNEYLDKTRYVDVSDTDPLPVNPDFFRSGGGTY